jgi:hypothetical protein
MLARKYTAHIGWIANILYQQIICRATLFLRESIPPLVRGDARVRKPFAQRYLANFPKRNSPMNSTLVRLVWER